MLKLVKFSCGCIGTEPVDGMTHKVYDCRYDSRESELEYCIDGFADRDGITENGGQMKSFVPLGAAEYNKIMQALGQVCSDAARFRLVKRGLGIQ